MIRTAAALLSLALMSLARAGDLIPDDGASTATGLENAPSRFLDPDDGWLDVSGFLDRPYGFVPLISPITEPAVGYGALVAPVFIQANSPAPDGSPVKPNLAAIGGFRTEEEAKGWFAAYSGVWMDGRLETKAAIFSAELNLDFYGLGGRLGSRVNSVGYELDATGGLVETRVRLGDSPVMAGLRYLYADIQSTFSVDLPIFGVRSADLDSTLGGPSLILAYDTRDNVFTPTRGTFAEASASFHEEYFGASSSHQRLDLIAIHYRPLHEKVSLGIRGDYNVTFGDTPFYYDPYVQLRGVPALRYQGEAVGSLEAEIRWQFWKRFSLVAFGGVGVAATERDDLDLEEAIFAGGGGFRYELARRYGLHMGIDIGVSEEDTAVYVTFGSAWLRP